MLSAKSLGNSIWGSLTFITVWKDKVWCLIQNQLCLGTVHKIVRKKLISLLVHKNIRSTLIPFPLVRVVTIILEKSLTFFATNSHRHLKTPLSACPQMSAIETPPSPDCGHHSWTGPYWGSWHIVTMDIGQRTYFALSKIPMYQSIL